MNKLLYFAYGSNMLRLRLENRVGNTVKIGNYTLSGYKMLFNSGCFNHSYANIEADPSSSVNGVLYRLTESQIGILDMHEGYPRNYEKFYKIETILINGIPEQCIIFGYITVNPYYINKDAIPSLDYLNIILMGCAENQLIDLYNELFEFKMNNYPIKSAIHAITNKRYKGRLPIVEKKGKKSIFPGNIP